MVNGSGLEELHLMESEPGSRQADSENQVRTETAEPGCRCQHAVLLPSSHLVFFSGLAAFGVSSHLYTIILHAVNLLSAKNCLDLGNIKIKDSILAHRHSQSLKENRSVNNCHTIS